MPRLQKPLTVTGKRAEFAQLLRQARGERTFRAMARTAAVSPSHLSKIASGKIQPQWTVLTAYLRACQIDHPRQLNIWKKRWEATFAPEVNPLHNVEVSPVFAVTYDDLLHVARNLRHRAGNPSYNHIAAASRGPVPRSTIGDFFTGKHVIREASVTWIIDALIHLRQLRAAPNTHRELSKERNDWHNATADWHNAIDRVYTAMRSGKTPTPNRNHHNDPADTHPPTNHT